MVGVKIGPVHLCRGRHLVYRLRALGAVLC